MAHCRVRASETRTWQSRTKLPNPRKTCIRSRYMGYYRGGIWDPFLQPTILLFVSNWPKTIRTKRSCKKRNNGKRNSSKYRSRNEKSIGKWSSDCTCVLIVDTSAIFNQDKSKIVSAGTKKQDRKRQRRMVDANGFFVFGPYNFFAYKHG